MRFWQYYRVCRGELPRAMLGRTAQSCEMQRRILEGGRDATLL